MFLMVDEVRGKLLSNGLMTPNEVRKLLGLVPINDGEYVMKNEKASVTNCKNCGAPLNEKNHCEYCGTQY